MNGIKDIPHREFLSLAAARRFSAWVDGKLGYPSGEGTRSYTLRHARIEAHEDGQVWAYPLTPTVKRLLVKHAADVQVSEGTHRERLAASWAREIER